MVKWFYWNQRSAAETGYQPDDQSYNQYHNKNTYGHTRTENITNKLTRRKCERHSYHPDTDVLKLFHFLSFALTNAKDRPFVVEMAVHKFAVHVFKI
jgi:hypothetical protein